MSDQQANAVDRRTEGSAPVDAAILAMAERELAAFVQAVDEVFGSDHARRSFEDWMEELELMDFSAGEGIPEWRRVTVAAAARLVSWVKNEYV